MSEERTIRERVAVIEQKNDRLEKLITDYDGIESFQLSLMEKMKQIDGKLDSLATKTDKMYPVFKEIIQAKFYGTWTFKILSGLGAAFLLIASQWSKIKHFTHYIFN